MWRRIYLLRHCETAPSPRRRCVGVTDIGLADEGARHAGLLKEYFQGKQWGGIYCSDALRAVRTAEIIAGGKTRVKRHPNLHEIDIGDWDGMYFDDIRSKYPEGYERRGRELATFAPPNGESFGDCQKRALAALDEIAERAAGDLLIVAHAGVNRAILCGLCHIDLQEIFTVPQPFGCVNTLLVQNGVCYVHKVGCTPV